MFLSKLPRKTSEQMNEPLPITPDFLQFYRDLAANNDRDWFHANKKRYESSVKIPFEGLVTVLIQRMREDDPALDISPKDAIFRINRDVRFSKDKSPYKLRSAAVIARGGKKDTVSPGMYFEAGPEHLAVYGGVYMPDKDQLSAIRTHIAANLDRFNDLLHDESFSSVFGSLHGERNKIIPKELRDAAEQQPLIFNKAFYFFTHMPSEDILTPDIVDRLLERQRAGRPMAEFLTEPLR